MHIIPPLLRVLVVAVLAGGGVVAGSQPALTPAPQREARPCFLVQPHWNVALDGPAPTCSIERSATPAGKNRGHAPSQGAPDSAARLDFGV